VVAKTARAIGKIRRYLAELRRSGVPVSAAYLFGSHARGDAGSESDIDVAILSREFTGDRFADRRRIVPLRRRIDPRIEPVPFRPEAFRRGGVLADEIKKHGIRIPLP
jgi:predicted nucleotidyltransferase